MNTGPQQGTSGRLSAGVEIARKGSQIRRLGFGTYEVRSQRTHKWQYIVAKDKTSGFTCTCPDFRYRHRLCKHIVGIMVFLNRRHFQTPTESPAEVPPAKDLRCENCDSSDVVKWGSRKTRRGFAQRFKCKTCRHRFIPASAFLKMKTPPVAIMASMDLYFKGVTLRGIRDHLREFYGVRVSHVAVLKQRRKYIALLKEWADRTAPWAVGVWHADEMLVKVRRTMPMKMGKPAKKGFYAWLWNVMDRDTRFWLAGGIHKRRSVQDARQAFAEAKKLTGVLPLAVVHDGLETYNDAFNKEFYRNAGPQVTNVSSVGATTKGLNQPIERLNGTIRDREKLMRGMHSDSSAQLLMDGYRVYYDFFRGNSALGGMTPAEAAGIRLNPMGNKWNTLIARAYARRKALGLGVESLG